MNKADLTETLAIKAGISKSQAKKALEALLETISMSLKNGERVTLTGFGTFSVSSRAERIGRNPRTAAAITIKARTVAKFKAGKELSGGI